MAADFKSCDPNALRIASSCFLPPCASEAEREAIEIYLNTQALKTLGGTDLTDPTALQVAAAGYNRMSQEERKAISLYLTLQNAIEDGATLPDITISGLKTASRCYLCMPRDRRKGALLYLKCLLNSLDEPD